MPRMEPKALMQRSERAWSVKRRWYALLDECWRYAAPGLNPYYAGDEPEAVSGRFTAGEPRAQDLFDSTLARSAERLANRMVTELFPMGHHWARLREGPFFGSEQSLPEDRMNALAATTRRIFEAIHASDCNLVLGQMALDGVVSGTGVLKVGVSQDSATLLDFEAVNQSEVALERGPGSQIWAFYRKMRMPMVHILALWPDARRLPKDEPDERKGYAPKEWQICEAVYYDPRTAVWYEDVLLKGDGGEATRIVERERLVCPWIAWRFSLLAGEVQGRSPVMAALPDARTLDWAQETRLESGSIRVGGMYTYRNDSTFNPTGVEMGSGVFLPVGSNSNVDPTVRPLELSGDPQMGEIITADHRESVKETMLDFPLPDNRQGPKTATEIAAKQAEARLARGQPYLRMAEEVGRPLLRLVAYLLSEVGQLPELEAMQPPLADGRPRPLMLDGTDVAVQFTAPAVQIQDIIDAQNIAQAAEISQLAAGPEAYQMGIRTEDVPARIFELLGVDGLTRDEQERAELMQAQQEAKLAAQMGPQPPMQ